VNRGAVLLLWAASGTIATAASGHAQEAAAETPGPALALSFADAQERLEHTSPALSGVQHGVNAAREVQAAVATMHRPIVTASAQYLAYQKTLSVDLSGPKQETLQGVDGYLSALPGQLPPAFQEIASGIVGRISQALPGLFSAIPDTLTYRYRDEVFNPTVQGVLPLYSGGAIPAVQHAAAAGVDLAQARWPAPAIPRGSIWCGSISGRWRPMPWRCRRANPAMPSPAWRAMSRSPNRPGSPRMPPRWKQAWRATPPSGPISARCWRKPPRRTNWP
jgi:hypothetical protein